MITLIKKGIQVKITIYYNSIDSYDFAMILFCFILQLVCLHWLGYIRCQYGLLESTVITRRNSPTIQKAAKPFYHLFSKQIFKHLFIVSFLTF